MDIVILVDSALIPPTSEILSHVSWSCELPLKFTITRTNFDCRVVDVEHEGVQVTSITNSAINPCMNQLQDLSRSVHPYLHSLMHSMRKVLVISVWSARRTMVDPLMSGNLPPQSQPSNDTPHAGPYLSTVEITTIVAGDRFGRQLLSGFSTSPTTHHFLANHSRRPTSCSRSLP
jgi:hypothetical protein